MGSHTTSEIQLIPRPQDHGTHLSCRVTLLETGVTKERTIELSVSCECGAKMLEELGGRRHEGTMVRVSMSPKLKG